MSPSETAKTNNFPVKQYFKDQQVIYKCLLKYYQIASLFFTIKPSYNGLSANFKVLMH